MSLARQVVGGTVAITAAGAAARLVSILAVPFLSPLLGPDPYGVAALVSTVTALGSAMALLGIDMAYARFFLQGEERLRGEVERYCWRYAGTGALISALVAAGGWYWIGGRWRPDHRELALYSAIAIGLSVAVTMLTARIRLKGNYRRIALSVVGAAVASSSLSLALAYAGWRDAWTLLLGVVAASVAMLVILGHPTGLDPFGPSKLPRETRRDVVSFGLAGAVTAPMYWVISSADRWFITSYGTAADTGIYTMAANVAMLGLMLNNSLTLTWFPEASRAYGEHGDAALKNLGQMLARMVAGLAIVWLAVTMAGGDFLRLLAAPAFHPGASYIPWLAGSVFFYGLAAMATTSLFLTAKMRFAAYSWTLGAAACLVMNYWLVPRWGGTGAAVALCVSYAVIALANAIASVRLLPIPIPLMRLSLVLALVFAAGWVSAHAWATTSIGSLALKLPVGMAVTFVATLLIAPDWTERARIVLLRAIGRDAA